MRSALLFATLVASALAGPAGQRDTCALHCTNDNLFSYQPGRSYEYDYTVTTSTALLGTLQDDAKIKITARAHIDVSAPCEHTLRLTQVILEGSSHTQELANALTRSSLRFSFQDGRVEALCAPESEEAWVLNFKRGLLSAFQSSLTRPGKEEVQETDILGVCITRYENTLEGDVLTINKVKEVSSCTQRPDLTSYLTSTAYVTDSPMQSLPVLDSTNMCNQRIEGGILTTVKCKETHRFRPFSSEEGGAITTAETSLVLVSSNAPATITSDLHFVRKSPVFETTSATSPESQVEAVNALLTQLSEATREEVRPQVPVLFSQLVIALKSFDYPTLTAVYAAAVDSHARRFLADAMPLVGTAAAAGVVRDMYNNGDLTEEEADTWFTSLAFLKNPTSEMFTAIAPLLETNPSQKAMLGTSALINTFCKINSNCGEDSGVQQVMRRIETHLGSGCRAVNEEQKIQILVALKALGNAGRWVNANRVLQRCYTEDNDMEVRVAALEAWRHTPCEYDRSHLLAAFQDETQDSEVRIAAYLAAMTCPTPEVVATIKDRLTSEGINQVVSFVWTHMTNLQESAAPGKEWVRHLIGEELLVKKFNKTEALKFSRNYESSFFMKELNVGAAVESNVIFSSKSYLPRSAMLNLTLDLFGESINLFEVGGRIEGFETYIERFFGPDGYFPEDTVHTVLKNMHQKKPDAEATTLETFLEQATDEPSGSYYLRVFGNDVHYRHFQGLNGNSAAAPSLLSLMMELARGGNVDYTKSYQLLDSQYSVPTVAGLPLTFNAKSTATLALRMDGNFQVQSLRNVHIEGHLRPSAAVHVDGVMMVDAHVTRVGLKVSSTLHTATSLDGKVQIDGGRLVDVVLNTPKDKMEVIDVDTKFFYLHDDQEVEQEVEGKEQYHACTRGATGVAVCGEVAFMPYTSPLYGFPSTMRVYLMKTDTQSGYVFRFTKNANHITFLFDNPDAQMSRKISLDIQKQDEKVNVILDTFYTLVEATGEYTWRRGNKHLKLDITMDGQRKASLDTGLQTSLGTIKKVEPFLVLSTSRGEIANVKGTFLANPAEIKYSADVAIFLTFIPSPITLKASYEGETTSRKATIQLMTPMFDVTSDAKLDYDANSVSGELDVMFGSGGDKRSVHSLVVLGRELTEDTNTYSLNFEVKPFDMSDTIKGEYVVTTSPSEINCNLEFNNGPLHLTAEEKWSHTYENDVRKINAQISVTCPLLEIESKATHEFIISQNNINLKSLVRNNGHVERSLIVDLARQPGSSFAGRIEVVGDIFFTASADLNKADHGHYIAQARAASGPMSLLQLDGEWKDTSEPGRYNIASSASLSIPGNNVGFEAEVYSDSEQVKVELQTQINEQQHRMKVEGTRTSILLDANVFKHILVNADITPVGAGRSLLVTVEWDKDVDPSRAFTIEGKLMPKEFEAKFKFLEKDFSARGKLVQNGVECEAAWSQDQRVVATLQYSQGTTSSLTATLETTFPGWERQNLSMSASLIPNEVSGRVSAIWRNTQQATLSISGRMQPAAGTAHADVRFTSTLTELERISFNLDHKMAGAAITTTIQGMWNDHQMDGSFQLSPSDSGVEGRASFTSPLTQPFAATLSHQLLANALTTTLEATYGNSQLVSVTVQGRLNLAAGHHEVNLVAKAASALEALPNAEANIKYSFDGATLALAVDGKVGQRKMMLNVSGQKTVTGDSTAVSGDLRFLTPFTQPLTASLSHTHDGQQFTSQFEITRIWSTYGFGSLKMHAEGRLVSSKDINFSAYVSSPETKGSFSFVHKINNSNMTSVAKIYANGQLMSASLNGTLDSVARILNLEGDITTSFEGLDAKVKIDSKRDGKTQISKVILTRGTQSATLDHVFTFSDALNWENSFTINNKHLLKNKMVHDASEYQHQMVVTWDEQSVTLQGRFVPTISATSRTLDAHLALTTPWESFENNKVDLHFEQEGSEIKTNVEVEYKPGRKVTILSKNKYIPGELFHSESSLSTPFWETFGYELKVKVNTEKNIYVKYIHGEEETTVHLIGHYQPGNSNGRLRITAPYLRYPVLVEGFYDFTTSEKRVALSMSDKPSSKYEAQASFSGNVLIAACELDLYHRIQFSEDGPWEAVNSLEVDWQHQMGTTPLSLNAVVKVGSTPYEMAVELDNTSLVANVVLNGRKGSLATRWLLQPTNASVDLVFQSPFDFIKNCNIAITCDVNERKAHAKLSYDTQEVELMAKMAEETFVFEGKTPFSGWETLGASFFASNTAINAYVSRNDRKIEVTGTQHLRTLKGKLELTVTTPYVGLETISFDASYNFISDNKTLKFKSIYGTSELSAKGVVKLSDPLAPKATLNISTPFRELQTLRAHATWNLSNPIKTAVVKVSYNDQEFIWNMETTYEGTTQRVTSKVRTPFPGWTEASLEASIKLSETPYEVRLVLHKEEIVKNFRARATFNDNTIHGDITTPFSGWETVALDGTYTRQRDSLVAAFEITRGNEKYEVNTDILFNTQNPKLKVEVTTPFAQAANIKLEVDSSLENVQKTFHVVLLKNDVRLSADITFKIENKTGFLNISLKSPIPGYTSLEVESEYDFMNDVKKADLNVTKEGRRQHFSGTSTLNNNNVVLNVETPFEGFEMMKMNADYTVTSGQHLMIASFVKGHETYNFRGSIEARNNGVVMQLFTPIEPIRHVVFNAQYKILSSSVQGSIHFERNDDIFEFRTQCQFTPVNSSLSLEMTTPVVGWNKLALNINYNIASTKKTAQVSIQRDTFHKELSVDSAYSRDSGYLTLRTPVPGLEVLGAEYSLALVGSNEVNALVKVSQNSHEWNLSVYGRYSEDSITIKFQTPFEGYEEASLKADFNVPMKTAKASLQIGSHTFSINASYTLGDMFLEVSTPFPVLHFGSVSIKHTVKPGHLDASVTVVYNENNYFLLGKANVSPMTSAVTLQAKTPIAALPNASLQLRYNLENKDEFIAAQMTVDERTYNFLLAGEVQEKLATLKFELTTPFTSWTQVKFEAKVNLREDDKVLEVVLEREGSIKAISVKGKLIGSALNFDLRTPFAGLNRMNVSGSLNRAKRSLQFQMMNDAGEASILTSFNSLKFHLKTPFTRMEEVSFEIKKEGNTYSGEWKRNDNYFKAELVRNPGKKSFNLEVKSELQGWEFLALAGRLDEATEEAYARGEINERKVELTIKGEGDNVREVRQYTVELKTPYEQYQEVKGQIRLSRRGRSIKFQSNSSNFKVDISSRPSSGMKADIFVPNPTQNTILKAILKNTRGSIVFSSRFDILRSFSYEYSIDTGASIEVKQNMKINDLEVFSMEFKVNMATKMLHMDIHGRRHHRHINLHIHREGFTIFNIILKREVTENGVTTEKEMSVKLRGSGDLPQRGTIDGIITNTFATVPRTTTFHAEIDRTSSPKTVKVELTLPGRKLYAIDLKYRADLGDPKTGNFEVSITTPDRRMAVWKNFSGNWNMEDPERSTLTLQFDGKTYKAEGKMTLSESDMILTSDMINERIFLQWKFNRQNTHRDYFLKIGPESRYRMLKLKGDILSIYSGDVEAGFKASFQPHELLFTTSWNQESDGAITSRGSFTYGQTQGSHSLTFHRNADTRSADFTFSAQSNSPRYRRIELVGKYDAMNKFVASAELKVNNQINKIEIDFSNLNPRHSRNGIQASLPILPRFNVFALTLSHDFRRNKHITAEATIGEQRSYLRAKWNRNRDFDILKGTIDIRSIFIGEVKVDLDYNVADIADAYVTADYKRVSPEGEEKTVAAKWTRKRTENHLTTEMTLDTSFETLSHMRAYATADFSELFNLNAGLDYNDKKITIIMNVGRESIDAEITTPFEHFERIRSVATYNLSGRNQSVTLRYERGSNVVDFSVNLNRKNKKKGNLELTLTTPFAVLEVLKIVASWKKGQANVEYLRNDVSVSMKGTAQLDVSKSNFNLSFTLPDGKAVTIAALYDVEDFISGTGSGPTKLAALEIDIEETKLKFEMSGYRSDERFYVEVEGESSFAILRRLHLKLDSELNTQEREGTFEFTLNDFVFEIHNTFERYENGYYFKSRIESTLTRLPALVFGLGRRGPERIFTLGYGEEKELTFSINAKNNFRTGFSGFVDIPNYGYDGVEYDVTYQFNSNDEFDIDLKAKLGNEDEIEAELVYNSEGVRGRLSSPFTGSHSARMRRSISPNSFFSEVGIDDYNLKLQGGFKEGNVRRGLVLEVDIFGREFRFDYELQSNDVRYSEGKLVLQTPFRGWEKMGGLFTLSRLDRKLVARAEVFIPFFLHVPRVMAAIDLDLNNKVEGLATLDVAGEQFIVKSNLIGASLQEGYRGTVQIQTPFLALPNMEVSGKIKMTSLRAFEADLKVTDPYTTHEVDLAYNLSPQQLTVSTNILSKSYSGIKATFLFENLSATHKKVDLRVNKDQLLAEFKKEQSSFVFSMASRVCEVPRQLSVEARYASLEDLEATVIAFLGNEAHKVHGSLNIDGSRVKGDVTVESSLIGGVRKLQFNAVIPNASYEQVTFSVTVIATHTHSFSLDLDTRVGVMATVKINTPVIPDTTVEFQVTGPRAGLTVHTPTGTHKAAVSWRQTRRMPADQVVTAELETPLLDKIYTVSVLLGGRSSRRLLKVELQAGTVKHFLEAKTSMSDTGRGFSLDVETPFLNIEKAALRGSWDINSDMVEFEAAASLADVTNTFTFKYNTKKGTMLVEAKSPYIPTGLVRAKAEVSGALPDLKLEMALMNAQEVISGTIDIKYISKHDVTVRAAITTPLQAFNTANGVIKYKKDESTTNILFSLDHPITFRADAKFTNSKDEFNGNVIIKTSIQNFEYVEVDLEIPLRRFAPSASLTLANNKYGFAASYDRQGYSNKASATLFLDDDVHGGNVSFRKKAPYELAYKYHILDRNSAFHLRTDSSFFSYLM